VRVTEEVERTRGGFSKSPKKHKPAHGTWQPKITLRTLFSSSLTSLTHSLSLSLSLSLIHTFNTHSLFLLGYVSMPPKRKRTSTRTRSSVNEHREQERLHHSDHEENMHAHAPRRSNRLASTASTSTPKSLSSLGILRTHQQSAFSPDEDQSQGDGSSDTRKRIREQSADYVRIVRRHDMPNTEKKKKKKKKESETRRRATRGSDAPKRGSQGRKAHTASSAEESDSIRYFFL
jgi:hypothetical protein